MTGDFLPVSAVAGDDLVSSWQKLLGGVHLVAFDA